MHDRMALEARKEARAGDFAGYLKRNLSTAYRLVTMALDDPIAAGDVVHDAAMEAWRVGGEWPAPALDAAFRRALESRLRTPLKPVEQKAGEGPLPLSAALLSMGADDRLALVRDFGLAEEPPGRKPALLSRGSPGRGSSKSLSRLAARTASNRGADDEATRASLETRLRALYASRDPGEEAPLALRLRLQRSLYEAETAAAERDEIARAAGWGFAINAFLVILVLTIIVALASVTDLRASRAALVSSAGDPTTPLTITSVSAVQSGIQGSSVHVAATRDSLVATFQGSTDWHPEPRQCLADVAGIIDSAGQVQWLGQPAGRVESMAGDPTSANVYVSGLGEYCDFGHRSSVDGGYTWASGPLPPGAAGSPNWLAFDPAIAGTLLAAGDGRLFLSHDAGATWSNSPETVAPLGFDSAGRLLGWGPGALFESLDDGSTWQQIDTGPATQPKAGAAVSGGVLLGEPDGLWWFPLDRSPALVQSGGIYSIATVGDGAIVIGGDALGHPWLGTFSYGPSNWEFRPVSLPPGLASLAVTGGQVAANSNGAAVAFAGSSSVIALAEFAR